MSATGLEIAKVQNALPASIRDYWQEFELAAREPAITGN